MMDVYFFFRGIAGWGDTSAGSVTCSEEQRAQSSSQGEWSGVFYGESCIPLEFKPQGVSEPQGPPDLWYVHTILTTIETLYHTVFHYLLYVCGGFLYDSLKAWFVLEVGSFSLFLHILHILIFWLDF